MTETESGAMRPPAKGLPSPQELEEAGRVLLRRPGRSVVPQRLSAQPVPPRTAEGGVCHFKPLSLWSFVLAALGN